MHRSWILGSAFIAWFLCGTTYAQSRLNFPIVLSGNDLATTGIAVVNTSSSPVDATLGFYGTDGQQIGAQYPLNIPAGGQIARLASEIIAKTTSSGWIQIVSPTGQLQGFELVGDFATILDGAGAAGEGQQFAAIHFSRDDIIHVANPGSTPGTVHITLNSASGGVLGTKSVSLNPLQPATVNVSDLSDDANIDTISISSDVAVSVSVTTKLPGSRDVGVMNAVPVSAAAWELYFPFSPNGPQGDSNWKTFLGIANLATQSQTIALSFTPDGNSTDGGPVSSPGTPITVLRNVPPGGTVGDSVASLFALPSDKFTAGWIHVYGSGPLAGSLAYQDSTTGALAAVPSQGVGSSRVVFGQIASLFPWYTGIGLLNPTNYAANVEISAIDSNGKLIGSLASFSLPGGTRSTKLLSELVPAVTQRLSDGGFVYIRSANSVPLLSFELFGNAVYPILANVQGSPLSSGSTYLSPISTDPISGITISDLSFTDGTTPKTQFNPKDTIQYVATLLSTSDSSGSAQLTLTVIDPRGQTMLTSVSPVALTVSSNISYTSFIPSNALNGQYIATATLAYQGKTTTIRATFTVAKGMDTPTVAVGSLSTLSSSLTPQIGFRPGTRVRFVIPASNFTDQNLTSNLTYQLLGPALYSLPVGSKTITVPTGLSSQAVDVDIPSSAPQGLYSFRCQLPAGAVTVNTEATISVVPRSPTDGVILDSLFVTDDDGIPQGGFYPGSSINLNFLSVSSFPMTVPATVRYKMTGPDSDSTIDQQISLSSGPNLVSAPTSVPNTEGSYTFTVTITYADEDGISRTVSQSTTFFVSFDTPDLVQAVSIHTLTTADINGVFRTSFSAGETIRLFAFIYNTFPTTVTENLHYHVANPSKELGDLTRSADFNPGMSSTFISMPILGSASPQNYNVILTANRDQTLDVVSSSTPLTLTTGPAVYSGQLTSAQSQ